MRDIILKKVKWHPKTNKIAQIPEEGLEFAMLSPNYQQLNQLVWCKDFIQDLVWSHLNNQNISIYGLKYEPSTSPSPSLAKIKLLISNYKDQELEDKIFNKALPLIHSVENRLKMKNTVVEKCSNAPSIYKKSGVWILNGSKRWLKSPPMISFYTFLIRIGLVHDKEDSLEITLDNIKNDKVKTYYDNCGRDKDLAIKAYNGIKRILNESDRAIFPANMRINFPLNYGNELDRNSTMTVSNIHEYCGIAGFSSNKTKIFFPNWHKNEA